MEKHEQEIASLKATINSLQEAIDTRIKELSSSTAPETMFTCKEFKQLKSIISTPAITKETEGERDVREIAKETFKQYMAYTEYIPTAWHIYKRAFDIASFSLPVDREKMITLLERVTNIFYPVVDGHKELDQEELLNEIKEFLKDKGQSFSMSRKKGEFVVCSAVKYNGTIVGSRRHRNCYEIIDGINFHITGKHLEKDPSQDDRHNQGFITSTGRYVDRKEAFRLAKTNNQIIHRMFDDIEEGELTSEDLFGIDH